MVQRETEVCRVVSQRQPHLTENSSGSWNFGYLFNGICSCWVESVAEDKDDKNLMPMGL